MRTSLRIGAAAMAMTLALGAGVAAGDALRTRSMDKLKDGSCQVAAVMLQSRTRDRLRDGSCAADSTQTRTRLRSRDCTAS